MAPHLGRAIGHVGISPPEYWDGLTVLGAVIFFLFWDLDNWMTLGALLLLAGFLPVRKAMLAGSEAG